MGPSRISIDDNVEEVIGEVAARVRAGEVGIVPTDTIYGLTGDANLPHVFARICRSKEREQPCSIIPPSKAWARSYVHPSSHTLFDQYYSKYAGPFTMLFPSAPKAAELAFGYNEGGLIAFRHPNHWLTKAAEAAGLPLLTTSVNKSGQPPMTSEEDLDPDIASVSDFIVLEGRLQGAASTLVFFDGEEPRLVSR